MELLEYWGLIRKRLWLIALLMAVAVAGTVYLESRKVPEYRTTTTLFLNPASPSPLLPMYVTRSAESLSSTYAEFMRTRSFADIVAEDMDDGTTAGDVLGALSTRYVPDTQFFKITATHTDPAKAQRLANTAAQVLIAENIARQQAQQKQIQAQQDPVQALERQRLRELQQNLQDELDYYAEQIDNLRAQITELENSPASEQTDERILNLRQELTRNQSLRVDVLSSLAQTQASLASGNETTNVDTAVVVDEAPLPTSPLPANSLRQLIFALVAAFGAGFGLSYLLEYIDYSVKTPEELDAVYGPATLGVIGNIEGGGGHETQRRQVVTLTDPRSPVAEAFRSLRTNIQFASPDAPIHSLLVTSAGPAEGKTLTTANLAVSLAQGGSRVILVDADLRKPRQHRIFEVPKEPGFSNLIIDPQGEIEDYLRRTSQDDLWVLPCGTVPPNPAELLGSPRAGHVMEQLKDHADIVVYDSPPAATVTDAVLMASRVDGVIQVVQAGRTRRDLVLRGKTVLEKVDAHILGPVLNQVRLSDLGYYSYYYYYGYYQDGHEPDVEQQSLLSRLLPNGRHRRGVGEEKKGKRE